MAGRSGTGNAVLHGLTLACASAFPLGAVGVFVVLAGHAAPALSQPALTLQARGAAPSASVGALVAQSAATSALAVGIAAPFALATAFYLAYLAPDWLRAPVGVALDLMAALPALVFGLWGAFVLLPWLAPMVGPRPGPAAAVLLTACVLAVMLLPTTTALAYALLRSAPATQREGFLALGATPWEAGRLTLLPSVRAGLLGALLLGLARALGEGVVVLLIVGAPTGANLAAPTLASALLSQAPRATATLPVSSVALLALLVLVVTGIINSLARTLILSAAPSWRAGAGRSP